MKDYPLEEGFKQFGKFVEDYLNDNLDSDAKYEKIYNKPIVLPSEDVLKHRDLIAHNPMPIQHTSKRVRNLVRIKKGLKRRYQSVIRKIFRV